jgi:hypothetical protein
MVKKWISWPEGILVHIGGPAYPVEINRTIRSAARSSLTGRDSDVLALSMQESPPPCGLSEGKVEKKR